MKQGIHAGLLVVLVVLAALVIGIGTGRAVNVYDEGSSCWAALWSQPAS